MAARDFKVNISLTGRTPGGAFRLKATSHKDALKKGALKLKKLRGLSKLPRGAGAVTTDLSSRSDRRRQVWDF